MGSSPEGEFRLMLVGSRPCKPGACGKIPRMLTWRDLLGHVDVVLELAPENEIHLDVGAAATGC